MGAEVEAGSQALMSFEEACAGWDLEEPAQSVLDGFWMEGDSLAPPCQTDMEIVQKILTLAAPKKDSKVYDLGCGDGRICAMASKIYGCRSCGVEIESKLIAKFRANLQLQTQKMRARVEVYEGDLRELDLLDATIIIIYLLPESIVEITPMLVAALQRGATIVCNTWGPHSFTPVGKVLVGDYNAVTLFKYDQTSVPEDVGATTTATTAAAAAAAAVAAAVAVTPEVGGSDIA